MKDATTATDEVLRAAFTETAPRPSELWKWLRLAIFVCAGIGAGFGGYKGFAGAAEELKGLRVDVQAAQQGQIDLKNAMNNLGYDLRDLRSATSMAQDGHLRLLVVEIIREFVNQSALRK